MCCGCRSPSGGTCCSDRTIWSRRWKFDGRICRTDSRQCRENTMRDEVCALLGVPDNDWIGEHGKAHDFEEAKLVLAEFIARERNIDVFLQCCVSGSFRRETWSKAFNVQAMKARSVLKLRLRLTVREMPSSPSWPGPRSRRDDRPTGSCNL